MGPWLFGIVAAAMGCIGIFVYAAKELKASSARSAQIACSRALAAIRRAKDDEALRKRSDAVNEQRFESAFSISDPEWLARSSHVPAVPLAARSFSGLSVPCR
jgi:hypothetical protein